MKLIWLRWLDAASQYRTWVDGENLDVRMPIESAGILVCEGGDFITIAADFDGSQYRDVSTIPKSTILEKRIFPIKSK